MIADNKALSFFTQVDRRLSVFAPEIGNEIVFIYTIVLRLVQKKERLHIPRRKTIVYNSEEKILGNGSRLCGFWA